MTKMYIGYFILGVLVTLTISTSMFMYHCNSLYFLDDREAKIIDVTRCQNGQLIVVIGQENLTNRDQVVTGYINDNGYRDVDIKSHKWKETIIITCQLNSTALELRDKVLKSINAKSLKDEK